MIATVPIVRSQAGHELDVLARDLALLDEAAIDRIIAERVAVAVREHRIDEAVWWQRVRLRARGLRVRATSACRA